VPDWYEQSLADSDGDTDADDDEQFDWDDGNLDHIARHQVSAEEAEEALSDRRKVGVPVSEPTGESRWGAIGSTEDGRILAVVFTKRGDKIRVVTARSANQAERGRYRS